MPATPDNQLQVKEPPYLKSKEAAAVLGISESVLRKSRHTGYLFTYPAPRFIKFGYRVFYVKKDLTNWARENKIGGIK